MRILFSSLGLYGHTFPLLPLAVAARELGHDVDYFTGKGFADVLASQGIEHVEGGLSPRKAFEQAMAGTRPGTPGDVDVERVAFTFASVLPRSFATGLAPVLAERKPDLVVHEFGNPGAGLAAKAAGVPALCHSYGRMWQEPDFAAPARDYLTALGAELGVEVPRTDSMALGHPYLDICPPSVQNPEFLASSAHRIPLRPVAFAAAGELPSWVEEHREPLVYLTLGTAFSQATLLRTAVDGLAVLGARVLVAAGPKVDPGTLGELPDNVVVLPWVPQADLLPHADLVVHHGGAGTTLGTFGAGVPQLVLPQAADQFNNGVVVTEAGLGDHLRPEDATAEAITTKARHLLTDEAVRAAAHAMAAEVAGMPSPHDVARTLPDYA
ncbi:glycosyltransferase family 1 protein [Saccharothrix sp. 6-C]|uniref:glycosyltransferase n=1 Tax=Saccharothrix sp. 6-C TaxID=2781735 RepID=UPI0019172C12|nr:glycosyltransferase [Saccharothrix sp. 6-C]QQQ79513.1 glycosyltransferase family 1 protein [Saccharothrix sp. 6-C]